MAYKFFEIEKIDSIVILWLNRPEKRNFMNWSFWEELPLAIHEINEDTAIRSFILAAKGASFSIGLDLPDFVNQFSWLSEEQGAENREKLHALILQMQKGLRALADSPKPSIAAVHRHCIGGALDLISSCDIRYCTADAMFSLREVKVAIVADMGSLQRLPYIIGEGITRELALTGRDFSAEEAFRWGLVTHISEDKTKLLEKAKQTAEEIAGNPPFTVRGVKYVMKAQQGLTPDQGLDFVALYNAGYLQSSEFSDLVKGFQNRKKKQAGV